MWKLREIKNREMLSNILKVLVMKFKVKLFLLKNKKLYYL